MPEATVLIIAAPRRSSAHARRANHGTPRVVTVEQRRISRHTRSRTRNRHTPRILAGIDVAYGALAAYVARHELAVDGAIREYYTVAGTDTPDSSA
jgi:hypothetical protein